MSDYEVSRLIVFDGHQCTSLSLVVDHRLKDERKASYLRITQIALVNPIQRALQCTANSFCYHSAKVIAIVASSGRL